MLQKRMPGIKVRVYTKNTKDLPVEQLPTPPLVKIPMSMHIGAPCDPKVKKGDQVHVGTLIGDSEAAVSAPIHSSVSGMVKGFEDITYFNGMHTVAVVIETDGKQTYDETLAPPVIDSFETFIDAIKKSGLVGLGGAGFPTHIKFSPKNRDNVHTLIVNGAECEPFITSDYRIMMDHTKEILEGIDMTCQYLQLKRCIIAIEEDKQDAIDLFRRLSADDSRIDVISMKAIYPRGAEKVITYDTTGIVVSEGKFPADVGVLVANIRTIYNIALYYHTGIPLVQKVITVDGSAVNHPQNVRVPIGTRISDVIEFCGGYKHDPRLILMGGPMMGSAVYTDDYPVIKNNNAILAFDEKGANIQQPSPCIRCGQCIRSCPIGLMPLAIERAVEQQNCDELRALKVNLCMECGCCSYACPAKRQLVLSNKIGKQKLTAAM